MCGILAYLSHLKGFNKQDILERAKRISHRGPDYEGYYEDKCNMIVHERLAIVDVTNGSQPLYNRKKDIVLAANGEIYNHLELRKQYNFENITESDCEIIIHLREQFGDPILWLNKMNGMFAFVLLNTLTGDYIISRDCVGVIPLYYGKDRKESMWVSSELKGIHDICNVQDFPVGHYYTKATGLRRWYNPTWLNPQYVPSESPNLIRQKLEDAVKRQLMCDTPYGVLLSGGLDSSLIAAITAQICDKRVEDDCGNSRSEPEGRPSDVSKTQANYPRLHTFSIGLADSPDLKMARIVAKHINSVHHEHVITFQECIEAIEKVIYHLETYDVTTIRAGVPLYLLAKKIRTTGVKMVLSGETSDEIFGGYLYFHHCPNAEEMQKELVTKVQLLHKYDFLRANKATMAHGVELRVPFADKEFLDYTMTIDPKEKMCGNSQSEPEGRSPSVSRNSQSDKRKIEKYILRKAFDDGKLLPDEILWRQKEQFSDSIGYSWITGLKKFVEEKVTDMDLSKFPINTPTTKEAYYFRSIFEKFYPEESAIWCVDWQPSVACSTGNALKWNPEFKDCIDQSGRSVKGIHLDAWKDEEKK